MFLLNVVESVQHGSLLGGIGSVLTRCGREC